MRLVDFILEHGMQWLGIALGLMVAVFLLQAQMDRRNKIDLAYLLVDTTTGQVTLAKFLGLLGGAAGTWVFIYLAVSGHFDAVFGIGYLTVMILAKVAADVTNKMKDDSKC